MSTCSFKILRIENYKLTSTSNKWINNSTLWPNWYRCCFITYFKLLQIFERLQVWGWLIPSKSFQYTLLIFKLFRSYNLRYKLHTGIRLYNLLLKNFYRRLYIQGRGNLWILRRVEERGMSEFEGQEKRESDKGRFKKKV